MGADGQNRLTKSAYARRRKVSPAMVTHWIKKGRVVIVDGMVDVERSDELIAGQDPSRGGKGGHTLERFEPAETEGEARPVGRQSELLIATTDDKRASAHLKMIKAKRELGEYVEAAPFIEATETAFAAVREGLGSFPARLGATIAKDLGVDARKVMRLFEVECEKMAEELSRRLGKMADEMAG